MRQLRAAYTYDPDFSRSFRLLNKTQRSSGGFKGGGDRMHLKTSENFARKCTIFA